MLGGRAQGEGVSDFCKQKTQKPWFERLIMGPDGPCSHKFWLSDGKIVFNDWLSLEVPVRVFVVFFCKIGPSAETGILVDFACGSLRKQST